MIGGWSFLSRSYGLGCDNVISVRLVLANGTIVTASKHTNVDLFWSSQGGGGGNLYIATSFILNMPKPRSEIMVVGEVCWPPFDEVTMDLWGLWLEYYPTMPRYMDMVPCWLPPEAADSTTGATHRDGRRVTSDIVGINTRDTVDTIDTVDALAEERLFCFTVICNGNPSEECDPIINPILHKYPPTVNTLQNIPFLDWQTANTDLTDAQGGNLYLTSGVLPKGGLTLDTINELSNALDHHII